MTGRIRSLRALSSQTIARHRRRRRRIIYFWNVDRGELLHRVEDARFGVVFLLFCADLRQKRGVYSSYPPRFDERSFMIELAILHNDSRSATYFKEGWFSKLKESVIAITSSAIIHDFLTGSTVKWSITNLPLSITKHRICLLAPSLSRFVRCARNNFLQCVCFTS